MVMDDLTLIIKIVGIPVAVLGLLGGLLALPEKLQAFRKSSRPHGDKGTGWLVLSRKDTVENIEIRILIFDDPIHALKGLLKPKGANVSTFKSVGIYFEVVLTYPLGTNLQFQKIKKDS